MRTKEVGLFREVMGAEQALVQKIVGTAEAAYLADIRNRTTNSINNTVAGILTHLKENYDKLMLHELLEREDIVKKNLYNTCEPITSVFSAVKELLNFSVITGTSYTQLQAVNISYAILHQTRKFGLVIRKWNHMPAVQKTWVFKTVFLRLIEI